MESIQIHFYGLNTTKEPITPPCTLTYHTEAAEGKISAAIAEAYWRRKRGHQRQGYQGGKVAKLPAEKQRGSRVDSARFQEWISARFFKARAVASDLYRLRGDAANHEGKKCISRRWCNPAVPKTKTSLPKLPLRQDQT